MNLDSHEIMYFEPGLRRTRKVKNDNYVYWVIGAAILVIAFHYLGGEDMLINFYSA